MQQIDRPPRCCFSFRVFKTAPFCSYTATGEICPGYTLYRMKPRQEINQVARLSIFAYDHNNTPGSQLSNEGGTMQIPKVPASQGFSFLMAVTSLALYTGTLLDSQFAL
jgi:hypothetical protein